MLFSSIDRSDDFNLTIRKTSVSTFLVSNNLLSKKIMIGTSTSASTRSAGAIAGAVIGVLTGIGIIVSVIVYCANKSNRSTGQFKVVS
jgi:hypothetical protein